MTERLTRVGVVGLGTMGAGIVEVFARAGLSVTAVEVADEALARGRGHVEKSTARAVDRGRLGAGDRNAILERIRFSTAMEDLADAELVVEAVPERMELKTAVFSQLDAMCPPDTILATNTSSLSVTELAVTTGRPGRVVGMHFFNPAPVMKLVEIVRTVVTEDAVVDDVAALAARLGKVGVPIGDRAGFIANALLFGYLNAAVRMLEEGRAGRDDIDAALRLGAGLPMGPFALLDLIGLDTSVEILETMHAQSRDRLHAPSPLLRQLTTAGLLGRKSGRGFHTYAGPGSGEVVEDAQTARAAPLEGARDVRRVGVVGPGAEAEELATALASAGYDVRRRVADGDLVVVADAGSREATEALFADLGRTARPGAVLATASARVPVVVCAAASGRPADVVGLHPVRELVEVVPAVTTAPDVVATASAVCSRLGRRSVGSADRAGFVVEALLFPYLNDAVRMLEAGYATADQIDAAMTLGCGYPVGPFEQLDAVGPEVALDVQRRLYDEVREPGLAPAPLLQHLVTAGRGFRHPATA